MSDSSSTSSKKRFSRTAIASFLAGLLAFPILGILYACVAVIAGHLGVWKCRRQGLRGYRLAMIGLVLGYISLSVTPVILLGLGFVGYTRGDEIKVAFDDLMFQRRVEASYTSAARLFLACETYASQNGGQYPTDWNQLSGRYLTRQDLKQQLKSAHPNGPAESFRLVPHERPPLPAIMDTVAVIQEIAPPNVREVVVVYADGNSGLVSNPNYVREEKVAE